MSFTSPPVPLVTTYIVIVSNLIPSDEQSLKRPGHEYPAHIQQYKEAIEFTSESALKTWIESNAASRKQEFTAFKVNKLTVTIDIRLEDNKLLPVNRGTLTDR